MYPGSPNLLKLTETKVSKMPRILLSFSLSSKNVNIFQLFRLWSLNFGIMCPNFEGLKKKYLFFSLDGISLSDKSGFLFASTVHSLSLQTSFLKKILSYIIFILIFIESKKITIMNYIFRTQIQD